MTKYNLLKALPWALVLQADISWAFSLRQVEGTPTSIAASMDRSTFVSGMAAGCLSLVMGADKANAFDGGVGGLGKTKPETGA